MAEESKGSFFPTYQTACNIALWTMRLFSCPAEMFMHVGLGERFLGVSGLLALVLMNLYALLWPPEQGALLYILVTAFFFRIVIHRALCIYRRVRGGPPLHSRYAGTPIVSYLIPWVPEHVMRWIESILLFTAGAMINKFNHPLGSYIMWSGAGLFGMNAVRTTIAYNKLLDALDAQIESANLAAAVQDRQRQR